MSVTTWGEGEDKSWVNELIRLNLQNQTCEYGFSYSRKSDMEKLNNFTHIKTVVCLKNMCKVPFLTNNKKCFYNIFPDYQHDIAL